MYELGVVVDELGVPGVIFFGEERSCRELKVVGTLAENAGFLHVSLQIFFSYCKADYREWRSRRVDDEGVKVREEAGELEGRAVEGCPVAAGSVEAESVGVVDFAVGDFEYSGIYQAE